MGAQGQMEWQLGDFATPCGKFLLGLAVGRRPLVVPPQAPVSPPTSTKSNMAFQSITLHPDELCSHLDLDLVQFNSGLLYIIKSECELRWWQLKFVKTLTTRK